jgi:hypothetical protein
MSDGRKLGKQRYDLVSPIVVPVMARVLTQCGLPVDRGGKGYKPHDWLEQTATVDLISAAERHLTKFKLGEDIDEETNLPHIDLALTNLGMLSHMYHHEDFTEKFDDRGALGFVEDFPDLQEVLK